MKRCILLVVAVTLLSGCAFLGGIFKPGEIGPDGKRKSLGRDLGGAIQMVVEGEWIAGGIAGLAAVFAAGGRYFFRRGERAEKRKVGEIALAVEKTRNGEPVNEDLAMTGQRMAPPKKVAPAAKKKKAARSPRV
jgi:hypothetical protein